MKVKEYEVTMDRLTEFEFGRNLVAENRLCANEILEQK